MAKITYPRIEHIDDLMPALRGRDDLEAAFIRCERPHFVSVDYVVMIPGIFGCLVSDPDRAAVLLRREARGIKFDARTGRTIARPHPKFFNLGQEPETQPEMLDWRAPHRVLEKLDGSMVHPTPVDDRIVFTTRKGDMVDPAIQGFVAGQNVDYLGFCREMLAQGLTPVFEWCSPAPEHRIVLVYSTPQLVLTAIRATIDGWPVDFEAMEDEARRWGVPVIQTWERNLTDIDAYVEDLRVRTGIEGVVIRWDDDGYSTKVKTDDYRRQHQFLEDIQREDKAIELVLAGGEDDVIPTLSQTDAEALKRYSGLINRALAAKAAWAERTVADYFANPDATRKDFVARVANGHDKFHKALLLNVMNRGEARSQLFQLLIEPQNQSLKSLELTKRVLDLPDWYAVRDGRA